MTQTVAPPARKEPSPLVRLLIDLGPLIVFFASYAATKDIFLSTGIFMIVSLIAIVASRIVAGRVSPMLLFSGAMVLILGGLTIWLHQDWFIKVKPTIYYCMVAAILGFGLATGRPTLKLVLGGAYPGFSERGWTLLTRNWAVFFILLAVTNELVWRNSSTDFWLGYKLWGALPATILFALANLPMLMRHGLNATTDEPDVPPQG